MKLKLMDSAGGGSITKVSISDESLDEFIDGCTVEVENGIYKGSFDLEGDCNVTINGGTFMKSGLENSGSEGIWVHKGTLTINGGTFSGKGGVVVDVDASGKLNITGGEFGGALVYRKGDSSENGIQLSGGSFYASYQTTTFFAEIEVYIEGKEEGKKALLAMLAPGYTYGGDSIHLECFPEGCRIIQGEDSPLVIVPGTPSLPAERGGNKNPGTSGTSDTPGMAYTISFDANGGTAVGTTLKRKTGEKYGTMPTPTRDGYTFGGGLVHSEDRRQQGDGLDSVQRHEKHQAVRAVDKEQQWERQHRL